MVSLAELKDTLDSFFHDIFVFMEGQGRGLTDYFSIAKEYSIFAVYSKLRPVETGSGK